MSKKIILSPVATGKTTFMNNNPLIACGEWLSTFNYYKKGKEIVHSKYVSAQTKFH